MPPGLSKSRLVILGAALTAVIIVLLLFAGVIPGFRVKEPNPANVTLTVWGTYDSIDVFHAIENEFAKIRSNVRLQYRELKPETYEMELINALAAGRGPDVFMFHNTWLPKHIDKIAGATETQIPFATFRDLFPQAINQDFAPNGTIFASPLYFDTLALFYNKDAFDKSGIASPPRTWTEFEQATSRLKEVRSDTSEVIKAGAAIGGSEYSINRATDLLSLLFLQSGTEMVDKSFLGANFARSQSGTRNTGEDALLFYTKFANPSSPSYTWNDALHYSVDNFSEGGVGMIFNYSHQINILRAKNPFLNFGVAAVPQIASSEQPVAYANYWGLAVSNKTEKYAAAWDFVIQATMYEPIALAYSKAGSHPPALRSLIAANLNNPEYGVFAKQALIARTWPQIDNNEIEKIFSEMIIAVTSGRLSIGAALRKGEDEVSLLMRTRKK